MTHRRLFSRTCLLFLAALPILLGGCNKEKKSPLQLAFEADFPDAGFRDYLLKHFDADENGRVEPAEVAQVQRLDMNGQDAPVIRSLDGLKFFPQLTYLACVYHGLERLDVSDNPLLEELHCHNNALHTIDLSANTLLRVLDFRYNKMRSIDLSALPNLEHLAAGSNELAALDLSNNTKIRILGVSYNNLEQINLSGPGTSLLEFSCGYTPLQSLNLSPVANLEVLSFSETAIASVDLSALTRLRELRITWNSHITELDVSRNTGLRSLQCDQNARLTRVWVWNGFMAAPPADLLLPALPNAIYQVKP